jgi:hypothetical protein
MSNVHLVSYLVEGTIPPEEILDEAGGVVSYIKRSIVGSDEKVIEELKEQISKISNNQEKDKILKELDYFIDEVNDAIRSSKFGGVLKGTSGVVAPGGIAGIIGTVFALTVHRAINSLKVKRKSFSEYKSQLINLRNKVNSMKFDK